MLLFAFLSFLALRFAELTVLGGKGGKELSVSN